MTFSDYQTTFHDPKTVTSWLDTNTLQMEINRAVLSNDFLPTSKGILLRFNQINELSTYNSRTAIHLYSNFITVYEKKLRFLPEAQIYF
jgi:hypothetical protein